MTDHARASILAMLAFTLLTNAAAAADGPPSECAQPPMGPVLTLQAVADRLHRCNPSILEAHAALAAAEADILSADHAPNPVLGLGVSNVNPKAGIGNGSLADRTVDSAVRIDQLIERGGKRAARRNAASATSLATREALRDTELRSEQEVLEAYLNTAAATASLDLLTQAASSYGQSAAAMGRRLTAGDVARIEVSRTELDAGRAEADAAAAAVSLAQARAELAAALGAPRLDSDLRIMTLDEVAARRAPGTTPASIPEQLVNERPDVKSAVARLDAAHAALAVARAARAGDVDVTLGFDHWPASAANPQGTGNSFTVGASIPLRIFDTGRGPVGHAVADVYAAETELQRTRAEAQIEIRTAQEQLANAEALAARYRTTLLPTANQILEAEEVAYRRGGASLLDLLDARRNARQVALAAVAAQRDTEIAAGRLALALGREPLASFLRDTGEPGRAQQNP